MGKRGLYRDDCRWVLGGRIHAVEWCRPRDGPGPTAIGSSEHRGGLAFAPKGKHLAVAHYGGVSLWWTKAPDVPVRLDWKGSHLGVLWHPAGTHLMTAMQEAELHGWRLKDKVH